jgi:hypothetical protein
MKLDDNFAHFRACCDDAPMGTYEKAKDVREAISDAMDALQAGLRTTGLTSGQSDIAHHCEAAMYEYVKQSNRDAYFFVTAEAFGASMSGPERDRIISQAKQNKDAFRAAISRS